MIGPAPQWEPYCGAAPLPGELLARWNADPLLLLALVLLAALLRRSATTAAARRSGMTALALAAALFVSPLCALSSALFAARVAHHLLLAAALAPLLVQALPAWRARVPGSLALWTALQALTFWAWHAPTAYAAALGSNPLYWAMQLSLLGTAFGFWAAVARSDALAGVAALLVSSVQMGLLGALITFAGHPLYAPHRLTTQPWGLTPLEDQQIAGLIMWGPSAALYLAAALLLARRWWARETREQPA